MRPVADELIQIQDQYYILASSSRVDDRTRVLKHGDTFAVLDRFGDIAPVGFGELGLYYDGTRFVSRLGLEIGQQRPLLLSSNVTGDNTRLVVDLTNPDLPLPDGTVISRGTLHLNRETLLWEGTCYEQLRVDNWGRGSVQVSLTLHLDADFADIFEVRGVRRARTGTHLPVAREEHGLVFSYEGLDQVRRRTLVQCSEPPVIVSDRQLRFDLTIEEHAHAAIAVALSCQIDGKPVRTIEFDEARHCSTETIEKARLTDCAVTTSNELFNDWLQRSITDLHMMVTETPHGWYPYAGAPWFSTPFGRDGIITALETLWVNPNVARGVLSYLAAKQAKNRDETHDAQPGKILHEVRGGEMAALGEVPFGLYYGSVDATPLFIVLAAAYYKRTADRAFVAGLWPHVERALEWILHDGDRDGDGFLEYERRSPNGLVQQGWKDSFDSVFHADGSLAEAPIALCEVQGYAYAALRAVARLARVLEHDAMADDALRRAEALRERFEQAFWCEEISSYALALDGQKRPCRVLASNAGHSLYTRVAKKNHAARVMQALMAEDCFSGWGIRTVSTREVRYNPMSYHNGSVWPHDNAILAQGFARYGFHDAALHVLTGMFEASAHFDLQRIPELFCGFPRRPGAGPTLYPVACAPQSWAAASVFMLLAACLGLSIDATENRISFHRPILPEFLDEVQLYGLRVGEGSADLRLERHGRQVGVNVIRRHAPIDVVVVI